MESLRSFSQVIAGVACLAIVCPAPGHRFPQLALARYAQADRVANRRLSDADLGKLDARLDALSSALKDADGALPRDEYDPNAVIALTGRDPSQLFTWVRDKTSWVAYHGALRGAAGVLMDRMGNSLDRALLLAALLHSAGFDARLAHATLTAEQAELLGSKIRLYSPLRQAPVSRQNPDARQTIQLTAQRLNLDAAAILTTNDRVASASDTDGRAWAQHLQSQLRMVQPQAATLRAHAADAPGLSASDLSGLRDHWWVQWHNKDRWSDLDPTAADANPGAVAVAGLASDRTLAANAKGELDPPADDSQEIVVRVVVEQYDGTALSEHKALEHSFVAPNLLGKRIALKHFPLHWPRDAGPSSAATASRITEWVPYLKVDAKPIVQSGFTDAGAIDAKPSATGTVPDLTKQLDDVFGGLAARPAAAEAPTSALTAEWVEYEIRVPHEASEVLRREVFDLVGPARRRAAKGQSIVKLQLSDDAKMDRALALLGEIDTVPMLCRLPPAFIAHQSALRSLSTAAIARDVIKRAREHPGGGSVPPGQKAGQAAIPLDPGPSMSLAIARSEEMAQRPEIYLSRPNLLNFFLRPAIGQSGDLKGKLVNRSVFDIVNNAIGVRSGVADAYAVRVAEGVADTIGEREVLSIWSRQRDQSQTTSALFEAADAQGVHSVVVKSANDPNWNAIPLSSDIRARAEADLAGGYVLIVPARPVTLNGGDHFGWWRVAPSTGETIGVMETGYHQAAEYTVEVEVVLEIESSNAGFTEINILRPYANYPGVGASAALDDYEAALVNFEVQRAAAAAANAAKAASGAGDFVVIGYCVGAIAAEVAAAFAASGP